MVLVNMKKILEDMGWSDGYHIPVANKENIQLEAEVERLTIAKAKASHIHDALVAKCSALEKHKKYVATEQEQNQNVLQAQQSQLETEKNIHVMSKVERDRLNLDIKNLGKDFEKVNGRKQQRLNELNNIMERMEKLKSAVEWDEQTIDEWEDMLLKRKEDNDIVKRFSAEDRRKADELEMKRQRLQDESNSRNQLVLRTAREMDTMELILHRNILQYRQMHEERNTLMKQWQDSVKNLQQRDKETLGLSKEILANNELMSAKQELLNQEKQFLKNEMNNNKEIEAQIEQGNVELSRMRKDLTSRMNQIQDYNVEMDGLKRELQRTCEMLNEERINNKNLIKERLLKNKALEEIFLKIASLKIQEQNVIDSSLTSNERVKTLEEMIRTEEHTQKGLLIDMENMHGIAYRSDQTLNNIVESKRLRIIAIGNHEKGVILLEREKHTIEKECLDYKEQMYKIDYQITMMESKVMRMQGLSTDDETEENEARLKELQISCVEVLETSKMLQKQLNRLDDVMTKYSTSINEDVDFIIRMRSTLQDQIMSVDGAIKRVAQRKIQAQRRQVEENVLKVRIKHAQKVHQQEGNVIYNLQKQHLELETMMNERRSEIDINKELLTIKKNSLNDDKSLLKMDLQHRRIRIAQFKQKNEIVLSTIGQGEDGEPVSVAYFKVKNAQEKHLLQEEGDRLDVEIRKAETEIIAMENTLRAVNLTNDTFKRSLSVVDDDEGELSDMKELEKELYNHTKALREQRVILAGHQEQLQIVQQEVVQREMKLEDLGKDIVEKIKEFDVLDNESAFRIKKMERADDQIRKITKKKVIDELCEKDFLIRELQDTNKSALQMLSETSVRYLETEPTINRYLSERDLNMRPSTRSMSAVSSSTLISQLSTTRTAGSSIPSNLLTLVIPPKQK